MQDNKRDVAEERGPLGDALPGRTTTDPRANPAQPPEKVEDRPNVGQVKPEDYPQEDRDRATPDGRRTDGSPPDPAEA